MELGRAGGRGGGGGGGRFDLAAAKETARQHLDAFIGPTFLALFHTSALDKFLMLILRYSVAVVQAPPMPAKVMSELLRIVGMHYAELLRMPRSALEDQRRAAAHAHHRRSAMSSRLLSSRPESGRRGRRPDRGAASGSALSSTRRTTSPLPLLLRSNITHKALMTHGGGRSGGAGGSSARHFSSARADGGHVRGKVVYDVYRSPMLPPFFQKAEQERVFYETLYNFVVRLVVFVFNPAYTASLATELNRLFRTSMFNARQPALPPPDADDPVATAKRLHSWRQGREAPFQTLLEKFESTVVKGSGGMPSLVAPSSRFLDAVPVRKVIHMRSPLVAAFLPTRAERIKAAEAETREITRREAREARKRRRIAHDRRRRRKRTARLEAAARKAAAVKARKAAAISALTGGASARAPDAHDAADGDDQYSFDSQVNDSSLSGSSSTSSASSSSWSSSESSLASAVWAKVPFRDELGDAWYDGLYSTDELSVRINYVNSRAIDVLLASQKGKPKSGGASLTSSSAAAGAAATGAAASAKDSSSGRQSSLPRLTEVRTASLRGSRSRPLHKRSLVRGPAARKVSGSGLISDASIASLSQSHASHEERKRRTSSAAAGSIEVDLLAALKKAKLRREETLPSSGDGSTAPRSSPCVRFPSRDGVPLSPDQWRAELASAAEAALAAAAGSGYMFETDGGKSAHAVHVPCIDGSSIPTGLDALDVGRSLGFPIKFTSLPVGALTPEAMAPDGGFPVAVGVYEVNEGQSIKYYFPDAPLASEGLVDGDTAARAGFMTARNVSKRDVARRAFFHPPELERARYLAVHPRALALVGDEMPALDVLAPGESRARALQQATVWMGSAGVVAHSHYDLGHNMYAQLYGSKTFHLAPHSAVDALGGAYAALHPGKRIARGQPVLGQFPLVAALAAADVLYMPPMWWHSVRAETPSISVNVWHADAGVGGARVASGPRGRAALRQWVLEVLAGVGASPALLRARYTEPSVGGSAWREIACPETRASIVATTMAAQTVADCKAVGGAAAAGSLVSSEAIRADIAAAAARTTALDVIERSIYAVMGDAAAVGPFIACLEAGHDEL
ncbi:uncharacterized protein AMSG_12377 [Thecamonas trahens ATCC 50062]|uniref:JmjC domain-containing protein n=1 Tax=Thecamonas trahens ATCC 50062 TaxID=461836 RepID=A0A0L0DS81_THETB|nr:hypothetical protein AMSG_12377 [Thecamonas trahens ATCC 50062]KNC55067.1 hypothetical protein AMSG_12377 [Thecamonas trahens ATCC 50062]|eukprot:XP_013753384.1 hypothetical protein AMSG_12377 [Thecamonas trahens ATCC 50062]